MQRFVIGEDVIINHPHTLHSAENITITYPKMTGSSLNARGNEIHNDLVLGDCSQLFHIPAFTIAKLVSCFYSTSNFAKSYQVIHLVEREPRHPKAYQRRRVGICFDTQVRVREREQKRMRVCQQF